MLTILLVVFGIRLPPLDPDGSSLWKFSFSATSRESLIPLGIPLGLLVADYADGALLKSVFLERYPIIWLIMTFAVLSYAMEQSGFFRYLATRTLLLCRGSVPRLTIGFFVLSSVLTYLASNDIVVLVMTPLVLELSRQSGIRDVRLILLVSCFIAANTLSMATVFGSPFHRRQRGALRHAAGRPHPLGTPHHRRETRRDFDAGGVRGRPAHGSSPSGRCGRLDRFTLDHVPSATGSRDSQTVPPRLRNKVWNSPSR